MLQSYWGWFQNKNENVPFSCELYDHWLVYLVAKRRSFVSRSTVFETDWFKRKRELYLNAWSNPHKLEKMELSFLSVEKASILCDSNSLYWIHNFFQTDFREEEKVNKRLNLQIWKWICKNYLNRERSRENEEKSLINETLVKESCWRHGN